MRPTGTAAELERRRTRAVELLNNGESPTVIARILGVCRTSLYRWKKMAQADPKGLAAKAQPRAQGASAKAASRTQGPTHYRATGRVGNPPAPRGRQARLAQRPVDGPTGRRDAPPPLRDHLPRRTCPHDPPAPATMEQPEAAEEGQAAQQ